MNEQEFLEAVKNMRNRTTRMEHEGGYWSKEERRRLEQLFYSGTGITEIAILLQRTEPAVAQQIEKQDLYQRQINRQRKKGSRDRCVCLCGKCEVDPACCPCREALVPNQEGV